MSTRLYLRGGTSTAWQTADPVLGNKELGLELDTLKIKIGDGVTEWNSLGYIRISWGEIDGTLADQTDLKSLLDAKAALADFNTHDGDDVRHITSGERTAWNAKADDSDLSTHTTNTTVHITSSERTNWNAKEDASNKGTANGYAPLDASQKVPLANIPEPESIDGGTP